MSEPTLQKTHFVLAGRGVPTKAFDGPQEAVVNKVNDDGTLYFVLPAFSQTIEFGPAPYTRPTAGDIPPRGTRCLALFVGATGTDAWIVAFANWPE